MTEGFELTQRARNGTETWARRQHDYLTLWLKVSPDGTAELTWEFSLGAYLAAHDFVMSAQDVLSLSMFPSQDQRGPAEAAWVEQAVAGVLRGLAALDLASGS